MGQTPLQQSRLNSWGLYHYIKVAISAMEKKKAKNEKTGNMELGVGYMA